MTSIKFDNLYTNKANTIVAMFYACSSLTSLYLPNLDTRNIRNYELSNIFEGCEVLELSLNPNKCLNLIEGLPSYVKLHNLTTF